VLALLAACAPRPTAPPQPPRLVALSPAECRAVVQDDASFTELRAAAQRSLDYLERLPPPRTLPALDRTVRVDALAGMLADLATAPDLAAWRDTACGRFRVYRADLAGARDGRGLLVTGYYQPELAARRERDARFRVPLYRTPRDLVDVDLTPFCPACAGRVAQGRVNDGDVVPYYTRAQIDAGALIGKADVLAWLDDPVDAFFLAVQGSGLLRFDDGVEMQISYASSNGRAYTSVGRLLVEQGKLTRDEVSLQRIRAYLRAHPDEAPALLAANERYIFFRAVPAGPVGSLGVPLTAGRSVAADQSVYPAGGVALLRIDGAATDYQRVVLVQDAGAAITGPARLDVYWGSGAAAEAIAGPMRDPGVLYLVLPE